MVSIHPADWPNTRISGVSRAFSVRVGSDAQRFCFKSRGDGIERKRRGERGTASPASFSTCLEGGGKSRRSGCPLTPLQRGQGCSLSRCRLDRVAEKHLPKPLPPALEPIGFAPVADRLPFPRFSPRKPKHMLLQIQDSASRQHGFSIWSAACIG